MMDLSPEELRARLDAIESGPWARGLAEARQHLAPADPVQSAQKGSRLIPLDRVALSAANKRKSDRLTKVLRVHFEAGHAVEEPKEIETRDAFDRALTVPQLWELAVQTGYLPEASVRKPARRALTELLWSEPARHFVLAYDYVSVPLLAKRVGISGIGSATPPDPKPNAALHFAGFLAHLREFHADEQIETWTRFLDDYTVEGDEQGRVWGYLRGRRNKPPSRIAELLAGCQAFVSSLASAFDVFSDEELGSFGLIHAYWLQKFFGYTRDRRGLFVKNVDIWGRTDSWAETMLTSPRFVPVGTDPVIAKLVKRQFKRQVQILDHTFVAVRALITDTRANAAPSRPSGALEGKRLLRERSLSPQKAVTGALK